MRGLGLYPLLRLIARPRRAWFLVAVATLCVITVESQRAFRASIRYSVHDGTWSPEELEVGSELAFFMVMIAIMIGRVVVELGHCSFAWYLPRLRASLRSGVILLGLITASAFAFYEASLGGSEPLPLLASRYLLLFSIAFRVPGTGFGLFFLIPALLFGSRRWVLFEESLASAPTISTVLLLTASALLVGVSLSAGALRRFAQHRSLEGHRRTSSWWLRRLDSWRGDFERHPLRSAVRALYAESFGFAWIHVAAYIVVGTCIIVFFPVLGAVLVGEPVGSAALKILESQNLGSGASVWHLSWIWGFLFFGLERLKFRFEGRYPLSRVQLARAIHLGVLGLAVLLLVLPLAGYGGLVALLAWTAGSAVPAQFYSNFAGAISFQIVLALAWRASRWHERQWFLDSHQGRDIGHPNGGSWPLVSYVALAVLGPRVWVDAWPEGSEPLQLAILLALACLTAWWLGRNLRAYYLTADLG